MILELSEVHTNSNLLCSDLAVKLNNDSTV